MQARNAGSSETVTRSSPEEANDASDGSAPLVSFFIPNLTVGGAEQVTVNIANGLAARGYDVDLLLSRSEGELQTQLASGVNVVELPPSQTSMFGVASHIPALVSYLRRARPAVLIPHMAHVSVVCLAINRLLDVDTPIVPTHHTAFGSSPDQTTTAKEQAVYKLVPRLYPAADRIIAVSEGVAESLVEGTPVDRKDVSVLHNPIDVEAIRERASEPVAHEWIEDDDIEVVLFVGRIEQQKDIETWLRAFRQVHDRNPNTRGVVAGRGSLREEMLSVVDSLDLGDVVSMPGFVENQYRYMERSSVFLLSSEYEGLPTVLIEALACGCQVVSTDCPSGPREILADGEYGTLVPVGDAAGLADGVLEALENPIPPERLRKRADEFSPDEVLDRYERFIFDVTSG